VHSVTTDYINVEILDLSTSDHAEKMWSFLVLSMSKWAWRGRSSKLLHIWCGRRSLQHQQHRIPQFNTHMWGDCCEGYEHNAGVCF